MLTNGVDYQIMWPDYKPGTSIFIPLPMDNDDRNMSDFRDNTPP